MVAIIFNCLDVFGAPYKRIITCEPEQVKNAVAYAREQGYEFGDNDYTIASTCVTYNPKSK